MIPVTKAFLPPIHEYQAILERAWNKEWITNRGELVLELEEQLRRYLDVDNILVMNNGTLPLQIAIKALGLSGEIITTPFSYVATTSAIVWENCRPVFVDIHPDYLTIDETQIEANITSRTSAILVTHVFGNPCHVEALASIARKHGLKIIYDAAHCFGVRYNGRSLFAYGDISTCSFHATKLFHTAEGGALFCNDKDLFQKLYYHHNFGHNGPLAFHGLGINAKISELQAAMGLAVLPYNTHISDQRRQIVSYYRASLDFGKVRTMTIRPGTDWNYSYFPVIFESESVLIRVLEQLNAAGIYPRRYFYPSLNTIEYTAGSHMPVSESIAARILCLPLYVGLSEADLDLICTIVNRTGQ